MVLANPIIYVAALLGAILAFNFFVNLSVKYAVDEVFDLENHMLDTKITSLCLIVLKLWSSHLGFKVKSCVNPADY